ncbi:MAG: hypothetical protein AB7F40_09660 [Victivallaceae bacterium]
MRKTAIIVAAVAAVFCGIILLRPAGQPAVPHPAATGGNSGSVTTVKTGESVAVTIVANDIDAVKRYRMVNELSDKLSQAEIDALYAYLQNHDSGSYIYGTKNDIINRLRAQQQPPPELTDVLLGIYRDENQDIVTRMYALQHLRPWYREQGQKDLRIKEALDEALSRPETELAGVALLAERYLSRDQEGFDRTEIAGTAMEIVNNPSANQLTRISAIQVVATLNGKTGDGTAYRQLSADGNPMMVRMAAIAALGQSGDQAQREYLEHLATTTQPPLSVAANEALKKLNNN